MKKILTLLRRAGDIWLPAIGMVGILSLLVCQACGGEVVGVECVEGAEGWPECHDQGVGNGGQ